MINNIRMMGGSENVVSSDTNPPYGFPSGNRCSSILRRLARDWFPQNQRWSRSYRASSFSDERDKKAYIARDALNASDTHYAIADVPANAYQIGYGVLAYLRTSARTRDR